MQTIGILGSGQLGRMMALAAKQLGYQVHVYSPESDSPCGQVADEQTIAAYEDQRALENFARQVNIVTFEFENIPVEALRAVEHLVPVYPDPSVLHIAQNRVREKNYLYELGFAVTPFYPVHSEVDLQTGIQKLGLPAVLKTAGQGYDGKGQVVIEDPSETHAVWRELNTPEAILEQFIDYEMEISVIGTRGQNGQFTHFGVIENHHKNHILDVSIAPAGLSEALQQEAISICERLMKELNMTGTLCIEFFVTPDQKLLINELAPRPHNSGHLTMDACVTGQFEQHIRAVCGLPLGSTQYAHAAAMVNLLGDAWLAGEPDWTGILSHPNTKLHLYGKREARAGRKMGHITILTKTPDKAREQAAAIQAVLKQVVCI